MFCVCTVNHLPENISTKIMPIPNGLNTFENYSFYIFILMLHAQGEY